MSLILVTAPAMEPVTLIEAKLHLRVDHDTENTLINGYIELARLEVEKITRRALITQTWDLWMDAFPDDDELKLPKPPLQSITSIKYYDVNNVEATMSSSDYFVDMKSTPGRVGLASGKSWPGTALRDLSGVVIRFVAGYGSLNTDVPRNQRLAMMLLIGHYYENREASSQSVFQLPMGVEALLSDDRVWSF